MRSVMVGLQIFDLLVCKIHQAAEYRSVVLLLLVLIINSGCAVQYYDKATQTEHLWGVGHFKMKVAPANEGVQAIVKSSEVVGVCVKVGADDSHLVVGWNNASQMYVVSESASVRFEWPNSDLFSVQVGSRPPFLAGSDDVIKGFYQRKERVNEKELF